MHIEIFTGEVYWCPQRQGGMMDGIAGDTNDKARVLLMIESR